MRTIDNVLLFLWDSIFFMNHSAQFLGLSLADLDYSYLRWNIFRSLSS